MISIVTVTTQENGCVVREQLCPECYVVVDVYRPTSSITPWDYYGRQHQREIIGVLKDSGLHPIALHENRELIHPRGSGRNGSVRFGDSMTPGVYKVAVPVEERHKAERAIENRQKIVKEWLYNNGPIPKRY